MDIQMELPSVVGSAQWTCVKVLNLAGRTVVRRVTYLVHASVEKMGMKVEHLVGIMVVQMEIPPVLG